VSVYAVGDVQGCYEPLRRLLDAIRFDPAEDSLWFVGDLVNRGPHSLETLRFVRSLGDAAVTVLGNHDLHLLVVASGARKPHRGDTLDEILAAPDREELLHWLRHRKLMHAQGGYALVHAGLLPQWSVAHAMALAHEVEAALRAPEADQFFRNMYGNAPDAWDEDLSGYDRLRVIVNAMTRLRLCDTAGRMEFSHKFKPEQMPPGFMPWFDVPGRASADVPIICGHWAAVGLLVRENLLSIDTGCVWGRSLTALRLQDRRLYECDCSGISAEEPDE
jgi:bis(5'-nucleosyl)-tetraphosphatase (symmetrical)